MRSDAPDVGHSHEELQVPPRVGRLLTAVAVGIGLLTLLAGFALRARESPSERLVGSGLSSTFHDARIISFDRNHECPSVNEVQPGEEEIDDLGSAPVVCPKATVRLLEGPDKGRELELDLPAGSGRANFRQGDKVVLSYNAQAGAGFDYSFADRQRKPILFWLAMAFAVVVVLLGRARGLAALAGLAASVTVLLSFVLPAILDGRSPILVALVGSSAIAYLALYFAHGFRPGTTVALLGTLGALLLTAVLALLVSQLAGLTGFASEEAMIVQLADGRIDLAGLVLAGVVIGALGAIDDMTVTQVAAVSELHEANPDLGRRRLYGAALRIGRDHVASTVNTLALAYAGASIPLLLLFLVSRQSLGTVANGEVMATEIVRTLVGSIGLVCSVPITTWLAVRVIPSGGAIRPVPRRGGQALGDD